MTEGSPSRPIYTKKPQPDSKNLFMIIVDEGWRTWILCQGMYSPVADQLIERLRAFPQEWKN